ncbi:LysR family transcriptional regulator [Granulosicoccus antarcticus]|uniref:PCP degradation transcriptional activation protein n=1 Tax=Granulosicoccus antarcticus IMCC3135 TaxID=1192854 RepID=A0A2Z2NTH8_9GAMM|nr:LysR family transcriptional regulator [Granulosicoccus antarcticus]ASJ72050.1 PCP degradation transcriptional activation protein [Granulosicoccus antarcticus IMCC3135]
MLLAFNALMAERNVTRAAKRVGLTQQGMSGQLARMRDLFSDRLFLRQAGGVVPTPRAEALFPSVQIALSALEKVVSAPSFDPATSDGLVTIAASDYAIALLLPGLLQLIQKQAPSFRVVVRPVETGSLAGRMREEGIDLALTVREFAPPSLQSRILFKDRYVGVVRAGHPLAGKAVSLDDFCASPHLLVSPFRGDASGPTDHTLAAIGRTRMVGLVVPGFSVVGSLLEQTDLMAVLPERLLTVMHRDLWTFETPIPVPGFELEAIWPERLNADPAHIWIRDLIVEASRMHHVLQ